MIAIAALVIAQGYLIWLVLVLVALPAIMVALAYEHTSLCTRRSARKAYQNQIWDRYAVCISIPDWPHNSNARKAS